MKPNISEFSYGYALTDELVHSPGSHLVGAPVFPSLYQEGQKLVAGIVVANPDTWPAATDAAAMVGRQLGRAAQIGGELRGDVPGAADRVSTGRARMAPGTELRPLFPPAINPFGFPVKQACRQPVVP